MHEGKRRLAIFGAMKELCLFEQDAHQEIAKSALPVIDILLCLGKECMPMIDLFKQKGKEATLFESKTDAINGLKKILKSGDVVLIKGANSFKLWTILKEF